MPDMTLAEALAAEARAAQAKRAEQMPTAEDAARQMCDAIHRLRELGWREALYAPKDRSPLLVIEPGSSGVHEAYRDDVGFWIAEAGDLWPSSPAMFMPRAAVETAACSRGTPGSAR